MTKYRKKPIDVEAIQWTGDNLDEIAEWMQSLPNGFIPDAGISISETTLDAGEGPRPMLNLWCRKSNAHVWVEPDGWVIAEADGVGYYPCTLEQFVAGYDRLDAEGVIDPDWSPA